MSGNIRTRTNTHIDVWCSDPGMNSYHEQWQSVLTANIGGRKNAHCFSMIFGNAEISFYDFTPEHLDAISAMIQAARYELAKLATEESTPVLQECV